jgi:transcriptional regulator with XRE-family HTH domain
MTYFNIVKTISALQERMRNHHTNDIAKASGVHPNTVRAIRNGVNTNPTIGVVQKIHDALDAMEGNEHE